jgi:hypothetical protein
MWLADIAAKGVPNTPKTFRLGNTPLPCFKAVGGRDRGLCVRSKICKYLMEWAAG